MNRDDKLFRISGRWALASDGMQWVLLRQQGQEKWRGVSFVRSTKDILARCMRERGTPADDARQLLDGLPATFDEWQASRLAASGNARAAELCPAPPETFVEPGRGLNEAGHGSSQPQRMIASWDDR